MLRRSWVLVLALIGGVVLFSACDGDQAAPGDTSVTSTAIHPCDDTSQDVFGVQPSRLRDSNAPEPATPTPVVSDASGFGSGIPGCDGPDFSQRCALWAGQEYDHGSGQDIGCGRTMAQCGCALTSAASLLLRYGVTRGPDGSPTTPASLNNWFKGGARSTAAGTVSNGFVYGGVNWLAVAAYSKQAAARFGTPELTYSGNLAGDITALTREVESGRPVILEQPGHFILATGQSSGIITIADPFYLDRTRLDAPSYGNRFVSGRLYKAGPDVSALMVAAPRGVQFSIRDSQGAVTGFKPGSTTPVSEVRQSTFSREQAWRDPTCTLSAPKPDAGVDMAIMSAPSAGKFSIEVNGRANDPFNLAVYAYDQAGALTLRNFEGTVPASGQVRIAVDYSPLPGARQGIELEGQTAPPTTTTAGGAASTATPTTVVAPPPSAAPPSATPTVSRTAVRSSTPTRTATRTPTPLPGGSVTLEIAPTGAFCNDADSFALLTARAFDAGGKPRPNAALQFSATSGTVLPTVATTNSNGAATARLYPGLHPGLFQITVTVRLQANPSINAQKTFTCVISLQPPQLVPGPN